MNYTVSFEVPFLYSIHMGHTSTCNTDSHLTLSQTAYMWLCTFSLLSHGENHLLMYLFAERARNLLALQPVPAHLVHRVDPPLQARKGHDQDICADPTIRVVDLSVQHYCLLGGGGAPAQFNKTTPKNFDRETR